MRFSTILAAVWAISAALGASAACSSFASSVDSPPDDAAVADAAADVSAETSDVDAGARGGFCASQDAAFCEDFDRSPKPETWDFTLDTTIPHATLTANDRAYVSPPYSAMIVAPSGDGGYHRALLERTIQIGAPTPKKVIVDYDWLVLYEGPAAHPSFTNLFSLQPDSFNGLAYQRRLDDGGASTYALSIDTVVRFVAQPDASLTSFRHVHFEADIAASTTSIEIDDAGATFVDAGILTPQTSVTVFIGANSPSANTPNMNQLIDNVVVRFER